MNNTFYSITLEQFAAPAFYSGYLHYAGTLPMISSFVDSLKSLATPGSYEQGVVDAFGAYLEGAKEAKVRVAYAEEQLIHKLDTVGIEDLQIEPFYYRHLNIWNFPYYIRADRAQVFLAYLRKEDAYLRYVKLELTNPLYSAEPELPFKELGHTVWGHPGVLVYKNKILSNRIMFCDKKFEDAEEARRDMEHPSEVNFSGFFNDIFGDG